MEFSSYSILSVFMRKTYHSRMILRDADQVPEPSIFGFRLYIHLITNLACMNDHKNDEMKSVNQDQEFAARFGMILNSKHKVKR